MINKIEKHIFFENDNQKNEVSVIAKNEYRACKVVKIKFPKINWNYKGVDTSNYGDVDWEWLNN
tara:strand:+ start:45 stop:236 length:192 start_codon:yes stop_codon:yes gene_type:complete